MTSLVTRRRNAALPADCRSLEPVVGSASLPSAADLQQRLDAAGMACGPTLAGAEARTRTDTLCDALAKLPGQAGDTLVHRAVMGEVRQLLRDCENGAVFLDATCRADLSERLTTLFMARTPSTAQAAELRAGFLDGPALDEARRRQQPVAAFPDRSRMIDLGRAPGSGGAEGPSEASQSQTRAAVAVTIDNQSYRVKDIKYGNDRAAQEVMAGAVMALTGLDAPTTRLAINGQHIFNPTPETRHDYAYHADEPARFAFVASPFIEGFRDLGALCLETEVIEPEIALHKGESAVALYRTAVDRYRASEHREAQLRAREAAYDTERRAIDQARAVEGYATALAPPDLPQDDRWKPWRTARLEKHNATMAMLDQMPEHVHYELRMAHTAALLTSNWDEYNWSLANTGLAVTGPDSMTWRVATVDHGNSLKAGFGGKDKSASIARAGTRARPDDPTLPNRPLDRDADPRRVGDSITSIGSVPRAVPVAAVIGAMIRAETRLAESLPVGELEASREPDLWPAIEMAFRLSAIPPEAFEVVARQGWPDGSAEFPRMPDDVPCSADEVAASLIARRDALVAAIPNASIRRWRERKPERARAAMEQVAAGVAGVSGIQLDVSELLATRS